MDETIGNEEGEKGRGGGNLGSRLWTLVGGQILKTFKLRLRLRLFGTANILTGARKIVVRQIP